MLTCPMSLNNPKRGNAEMDKLEMYADAVEQLDKWIKSYIKEICVSFGSEVMKLYAKKDSDSEVTDHASKKCKKEQNTSKLLWGFSGETLNEQKSLNTLRKIFLEILEEKIPSLVSLDEFNNILSYAREKRKRDDFYDGVKKIFSRRLQTVN